MSPHWNVRTHCIPWELEYYVRFLMGMGKILNALGLAVWDRSTPPQNLVNKGLTRKILRNRELARGASSCLTRCIARRLCSIVDCLYAQSRLFVTSKWNCCRVAVEKPEPLLSKRGNLLHTLLVGSGYVRTRKGVWRNCRGGNARRNESVLIGGAHPPAKSAERMGQPRV